MASSHKEPCRRAERARHGSTMPGREWLPGWFCLRRLPVKTQPLREPAQEVWRARLRAARWDRQIRRAMHTSAKPVGHAIPAACLQRDALEAHRGLAFLAAQESTMPDVTASHAVPARPAARN